MRALFLIMFLLTIVGCGGSKQTAKKQEQSSSNSSNSSQTREGNGPTVISEPRTESFSTGEVVNIDESLQASLVAPRVNFETGNYRGIIFRKVKTNRGVNL